MVSKGIILAAGEGTRLEPITHAVPKEMIRVGKKPTIEHVIRVLKAGGIGEITIVIGRQKNAILDYVGSGERFGVDVCYRVQEEPKGTAHAVSFAKRHIDDGEDFAVMYGDNYISPYEVMDDIVSYHKENGANTLVLHQVEDPTRYGIVKLGENEKVKKMIEKPTMEEAKPFKHNGYWFNIAGLMILKSEIFDYIEDINPGKDGELWLTDAVEKMRKDGNNIYGYVFKGTRYDIGTFESLGEADKKAQNDEF